MSDLQAKLNNLLEGKIDFEGQRYAEQITRISIVAISLLTFTIGLFLQDLVAMFIMFGIMCTFVTLIVVPPWSYLNQEPVRWLPVKPLGNIEDKKTT